MTILVAISLALCDVKSLAISLRFRIAAIAILRFGYQSMGGPQPFGALAVDLRSEPYSLEEDLLEAQACLKGSAELCGHFLSPFVRL